MAKTLSGKNGKVQTGATPADVDDIAHWTIEIGYEITAYGSSETAGHKKRTVGTGDTTGEIKIWQQDDVAIGLTVGAEVAVVLDLDGGDVNKYTGSVVVESFSGFQVNMDGGEGVFATYTWGADGKLTAAGTAPPLT